MENLQKDFLHYELALKMKQLGFDEPCLGYWRNEDLPNPITIGQYTTKEDIEYEISGQDEYHNFKNIIALAPLYQQAFRWFREKYGFFHYVTTHDSTDFEWYIYDKYQNDWEDDIVQNTYEEAELACLKKLIELSTETK